MTTKQDYKLPVPQPNLDDRVFWEGAKQHKLLLQKCKNCKTLRTYAGKPMCPVCHSFDSEPVEASGKGELWSFTVAHHAFGPVWQGVTPYIIGVVKLEEGPRLVTNIMKAKAEDLYIGMPLEVIFDDVTTEFTLPKFHPV